MSKRCVRAREHVSLALDGELSEFERALLTAHLAQCPRCRAFEADVVALTERLRAAPAEPLSRPIELPRRRAVVPARVIQAAAAAAAVVVVGFGAAVSLLDVSAPSRTAIPRAAVPDENTFIRQLRAENMRPVFRPVRLVSPNT